MIDEPVPEFEERRKQTVWERMDEASVACVSSHKRLGERIDILKSDVIEPIVESFHGLNSRVKVLEATPPDVAKLRFSTGVMVSIVVVTISIVGSAYGITNSVTGKIDKLGADMTRQAESDAKERASLAKLYDERNTTTINAIGALTRQQKLSEYEIQRLREDVTKRSGSTR